MTRFTSLFTCLTIGLLLIFIGCDEKEIDIPFINVPPEDSTQLMDPPTVLIEDFTGISCQNCPTGARIIDDLKATYGSDKVISVAVYTRYFDTRHEQTKYNLKTDVGQLMQDHLGTLIGKPAAAINRTIDPVTSSRFYLNNATWSVPVIEQLNREPIVNLSFEVSYDESTRLVKGEVTATALKDIDEALSYTVIVAENNIIDPQLDVDGWKIDYQHNHVLRDIVTAYDGDPFATSMAEGESVSRSISYTLPAESDGLWRAEEIELITFVHHASASSRVIVQTTRESLKD